MLLLLCYFWNFIVSVSQSSCLATPYSFCSRSWFTIIICLLAVCLTSWLTCLGWLVVLCWRYFMNFFVNKWNKWRGTFLVLPKNLTKTTNFQQPIESIKLRQSANNNLLTFLYWWVLSSDMIASELSGAYRSLDFFLLLLLGCWWCFQYADVAAAAADDEYLFDYHESQMFRIFWSTDAQHVVHFLNECCSITIN